MRKLIHAFWFALFCLATSLSAADLDGNGIEDNNEQTLANIFYPCFVLHAPDQGVSPEPVEKITKPPKLIYENICDFMEKTLDRNHFYFLLCTEIFGAKVVLSRRNAKDENRRYC